MAARRSSGSSARTNVQAIEVVIKAMRATGRLEDVDEAVVTAARTLARAVDDDPGNASLWREYRAIEHRLRSSGEGMGSALDDVIRAMQAPVGDTSAT